MAAWPVVAIRTMCAYCSPEWTSTTARNSRPSQTRGAKPAGGSSRRSSAPLPAAAAGSARITRSRPVFTSQAGASSRRNIGSTSSSVAVTWAW